MPVDPFAAEALLSHALTLFLDGGCLSACEISDGAVPHVAFLRRQLTSAFTLLMTSLPVDPGPVSRDQLLAAVLVSLHPDEARVAWNGNFLRAIDAIDALEISRRREFASWTCEPVTHEFSGTPGPVTLGPADPAFVDDVSIVSRDPLPKKHVRTVAFLTRQTAKIEHLYESLSVALKRHLLIRSLAYVPYSKLAIHAFLDFLFPVIPRNPDLAYRHLSHDPRTIFSTLVDMLEDQLDESESVKPSQIFTPTQRPSSSSSSSSSPHMAKHKSIKDLNLFTQFESEVSWSHVWALLKSYILASRKFTASMLTLSDKSFAKSAKRITRDESALMDESGAMERERTLIDKICNPPLDTSESVLMDLSF